MIKIFKTRGESHYNPHHASEFIIPPIHIVYHGSKSVSYLGLKTWELIPFLIRRINSFSGFKKETKKRSLIIVLARSVKPIYQALVSELKLHFFYMLSCSKLGSYCLLRKE